MTGTCPTCGGLRSVGSKDTEEAIAQLERLIAQATSSIALIKVCGLVYDPKYNLGENVFRVGYFTVHDGSNKPFDYTVTTLGMK